MTALGPLIGIDISKWDGNWDAAKAKAQGATFVFIKASQATYTDPQFILNWQKARDAGLLRAAYHYLDYTKPGKDQANAFADLIKSDPGELPPIIDYEMRRTDNNPTAALGFLRECLDTLSGRTELFTDSVIKQPMLYISPGFWAEYGDMTKSEYWLQYPLWLAHYTTAMTPQLPAPWPMWKFWQYTAKGPGEVFGSECLSIDMNRFNGTLNELMEFAGVRVPVINLNELYQTLADKTQALEASLASLPQASNPAVSGVIDRVTTLEQQIAEVTQTHASTTAGYDDRLTAIEQKIADLMLTPLTPQTIPPISAVTPPTPVVISTPIDPTPVPPATPITPASTDVYALCNTAALNVRSGPAATYPMVAGIYLGQRVKILNRQNGWAQVEDPAGWSNETYLTFETAATSPAPAVVSQPATTEIYGVCNTSGLNVRSGPGVTYPVVSGLTYGQRVKILGRRSGWAQIDGPAGWCNETYLSFA